MTGQTYNPDSFKLACLQHEPEPANVAAGLVRIGNAARDAARQGCQLLLLPEASLTGYNIDLGSARQVAQTLDGEAANALANVCRKHQIAIAYGFIERFENSLFNSVQLIDKQGQRRAHYRKTHLWGDLDYRLFSAGADLVPVVDIDSWRIGLLICYDIEFPETARRLALEGAELILIPTALMTPYTNVAESVVPVRAFENQLFIAYTNYCGNENGLDYVGRSCISGPDGKNRASALDKEMLLTATLRRQDISHARAELPYHRDRRPELYTALSRSASDETAT